MFSLLVENFGVKYVGEQNAKQLWDTIKNYYELAELWAGALYCSVKLDWYYKKRTVDIYITGYTKAALHKYQNIRPKISHNELHKRNRPHYGANVKMVPYGDQYQPITLDGIKLAQKLIGALYLYVR